jgi:adenine-specific DNA-methyltransferase
MVSEQTAALDALMGGHYFDTPKPVDLIKDLARWFTSGSDIVLDFFAGSGTTAQSVFELNAEDGGSRPYIVVQLPEPLPVNSAARDMGWTNIAQITRRRIHHAGNRLKEELPGGEVDLGFRSFILSDTGFSKWSASSDVEHDSLRQHLLDLRASTNEDATPDALLTEILLKQGYSLTERISSAKISGLEVLLVLDNDGDVAIAACLERQVVPTLDQLGAIVDLRPTQLLVLEDTLDGNDELKTNLAELTKSKGIGLWTA